MATNIDTLIDYDRQNPTTITREEYTNVGSSKFSPGTYPRAFRNMEVWDSASGGTQLTEGTDYEVVDQDIELSSADYENAPVYRSVRILNATYQTGSIYLTYDAVGTYTDESLFSQVAETTRNNETENNDDIPSNGEHFPLDGISTVSSKGREPIEKSGLFPFPARLTENGYPVFDSPYTKWTGHGVYGFFNHPENLFLSPEDLTNSNLNTTAAATVSLSDQYINKHRFSLVDSDTSGNDAAVWDTAVGFTGDAQKVVHAIAKKKDSDVATILLYDNTATTERLEFDIDFSSQSITAVVGSIIREEWLDSNTVEFWGLSTSVTASNTNQLYLYAENRNSGTTSALGTYWTAIMALDADYAYPYVKDVATPSFLQYSYEWPNQFTVECWVRPWFNYDDVGNHAFVVARTPGGSPGVYLRYQGSSDKIQLVLLDSGGSIIVTLSTSAYTSNASLKTDIHIKGVVDKTNDECYLYVDGVLVDSDTVTSLSSLHLPNGIIVGADYYSSAYQDRADATITDLLIISGIDKTSTHYSNDRPYYQSDRQVGKDGAWSLDRYGNARYNSLVIPKHLDTARADTDWHVIGQAGEPDYKNGWATGGFGFGLRWRKFPSGLVIIQALVLDASSATDGVVMTMKEGYVPSETTESVANNYAGSPDVLILMSMLKNGDVRFLQDGNTPSTTSIRGSLIYYAEQ